jgi:GntR family transcriptional regulator, arabinose operon transcriptional repressor
MVRPRKAATRLAPPPETGPANRVVKYWRIFEHLLSSIKSGQLKAGDRLPSEVELGKLFDASRITVAKAVLDLQRMGLVTRRRGAGTRVLAQRHATGSTFGLLIPELGLTKIYEPICRGMMRSPFASTDALLWGNVSTSTHGSAKKAEQVAQSFIVQKMAGVFFAPLEMADEKDAVNRRVVRLLEQAQMPVVLRTAASCAIPSGRRTTWWAWTIAAPPM